MTSSTVVWINFCFPLESQSVSFFMQETFGAVFEVCITFFLKGFSESVYLNNGISLIFIGNAHVNNVAIMKQTNVLFSEKLVKQHGTFIKDELHLAISLIHF